LPRDFNLLPSDCVSREVDDHLSRFLRDYGGFQPYCVSRHLPADLPQGVALSGCLSNIVPAQSTDQPPLPVVTGVGLVPTRTRPAMPLLLTERVRADMLPIARPGRRI